jgi:hypothetical protein
MAAAPVYAATPRSSSIKITAADTALDNPSTNVFTVLTPGASGTRIDRIIYNLNGVLANASTANVLRLWINDGTRNNLYKWVNLATATPSTSAGGLTHEIATPNLVLPATHSLRVTLHVYNASAYDAATVTALGADI